MARSCQNIFLTVFLCVVVLFLTGVTFPKFLVTQNVKLRTIFNSSVASLKFSSREQLVSNKTEGGNLVNGNIFESKNEDKTEKFSGNFLRNTALNSLQTQKLERNKRQIASQEVPKEVFAWNFNLNVSRLEKTTPNEAAKKDSKTSPRKQLGVAVYVENQESQETAFSELQKDLGIVGGFVKTIFSSGSENGTNDLDMNEMEIEQFTIELMGVRSDLTFTQNFSNRGSTEKVPKEFTEIVPALKEQSPTSVLKTSQNPDTLNFEDETNKTESHKGRKGRIFFRNIFRLGEKFLGRTTPVPETEEAKNLMDNIEKEGNIFTENESLLGHPKSEFVTKHFQQGSSFPSDSLQSESENSTKHVFDNNVEKLSLQPTRQQHGCPDCVTGSFGSTVFPSQENEVSVNIVLETTQTETLFSNEILEKYCISLLNTLEESQPSLREESLKTDTGMIEDSFVIKTDESITESSIFTDKPRRFFGIFDGGSGRSEIMPDENSLISERQTDEVGDLPSVLDCEEFFNKKENRKIFSTPNSLDANDLENTISPNFGNSISSPKLKEQLPLSTNLSSSVKMSDTVSEGKADSLESETSAGNESDFTVNKDLFINQNGEITPEFSDLDLNDTLRTSESTDADSEVQITDEQREGRIFNFFNFGSGSDVQENRSVSESRGFLGGSDANSLGTSRDDESGENIVLGSEESFPEIEAFSGDGRMLEVSDGDILENFSTTSDKEHRFFSFLGFAGSGSGREFIDSTELTVTELDVKLPHTDSENFTEAPLTSQSLSGLNDEYEDDCSDCDHEYNLHYEKLLSEINPLETSKPYDNINLNSTITNLEHESSLISFHLNGVNGTEYQDYATHNIDSLNVTENSNQIQTTEIKPRRFVETLFLTGSGDGGLFVDDRGTINLLEEESTIRPVVLSGRKGRLDDSLFEPCEDCVDLSDLLGNSVETARSNQTASDFSSSTIKDNGTISPMSRPKSEATTVRSGLTETDITFSSEKFSSPFPNLTPTELQPRSCIAARDCNITLGERCITMSSSSVCDCGRTFVRHKETRKCVAKGHIETKLKFPAEMFDSELEDRESPRYKLTSKKAVDTTWLLLRESPEVYRIVADVNVTKFTAGSLIISLKLVLALENEAEADTITDMKGKLQKALGDETLIKRASLNIRNATVLFLTSELDPCKSTELNYCSKNAVCVRNEAFSGRHTCFCKEHYLDVSSDPLFPGETCIDKCPSSYCGPNGHCEILENNERHCLCTGLYFGERCEVPGMVVIGSLSIAAFITLAVLVAVIIRLRCNKSYGSYGRTPTFRRSEEIGPHVIAGGRVSDAKALGEIKGTKLSTFSQFSTPMQNLPVIKVTQPTLNESSISFDFDSTFDETTSSVHEQRSENGNSTV